MLNKLWQFIYQRQGLVLLAMLALVPIMISNIYYLHLINLSLIMIILGIGLNLLTGYAGQISIGHAAFYGIGAYTSAIVTTRFDISSWFGLLLAGIVTAGIGYLIGRPTLKLRGAYLAIASIGIGEIAQLVMTNWTDMTGGALGIKGVKAPSLFGWEFDSDVKYFYLLAIIVTLVYAVVGRLIDSEIGRAFRSIKEEEIASQFMGVDASKLKVMAFVISAFLAGIAGSLFAHLEGYVSPYGFGFRESIAFLCMILAGGLGYKTGPVIGVLLLNLAREGFRFFNDYQLVIYGLLLIFVIVFMPRGIAGALDKLAVGIAGRFTGYNEKKRS